jgi:hypothetical protein
MSNPEKSNEFEQEWQKAFDSAFMFPPAHLWDSLEAKLPPEKEKNHRPLWFYYVAASVIGILLMGGGTMWYRQTTSERDVVSKNQGFSKEKLIQPSSSVATVSPHTINETPTNIQTIKPTHITKHIHIYKPIIIVNANTNLVTQNSILQHEAEQNNGMNQPIPSSNEHEAYMGLSPTPSATTVPLNENKLALLANKPFKTAKVNLRTHLIFFVYNQPEEVAKNDKLVKQWWLGLKAGAVSFDPAIATTYAAANKAIASTPAIAPSYVGMPTESQSVSTPLASYTLNIQVGKDISRKSFIEMGIQYLNGQSTLNSNGYLIDRISSNRSTLFLGAIQTPSTILADQSAFLPSNQPVIQNNNYQYLSIPIQAGYRMIDTKQWDVSILAGASADYFIRNTIGSTNNTNEINITPSDNIYKSLMMSSSLGLRSGYKLSKKWKVIIEGSFRKALTNGLQQEGITAFRPQTIGINMGAMYRF